MVEELDYHMGKVFNYLNNTEDPRWPGHKLAENTYVIFTSDNGGMEGHPGEVITDNYPLDKGKISAMEGGTRVPLIISGPGIPKGVESQVMVNGLDFYPTLLTFTKTPKPKGKNLDGCDLSKLLTHEPNNSDLVRNKNGKPRNSMIWHFPHSVALESTIRSGGFKLVRNDDHKYNPDTPELELYQLYQDVNGKPVRVDIEEANNLVATMPDKANLLNKLLSQGLAEMNASFPYYNHRAGRIGKVKKLIPSVTSHQIAPKVVKFKFSENGAKVIRGDLIYTPNGGARYEEWYRIKGGNQNGNEISFDLPEGATHYFLNLIDENNFLVSYPQTPDYSELSKTKDKFAKYALSVE
jgi:hypothetical protein